MEMLKIIEIISYVSIFLLAIIGTPLFVIMALFALVAFAWVGISPSSIAISIYQISDQPTMLTIPLFTFAGYMMAESKTPQRMLRLAKALIGWMPGGIAIMSLTVCAIFTAFTGASGVTIIALGGLIYPILREEGYTDKFALGLVTVSGSLGLLFAPSLPIILYGLVAKVDIDKLFLAGIIPGLFLIVMLSLYAIVMGKGFKSSQAFSWRELKVAIKTSYGELFLPIGVLGSIYGGLMTVTEAAAFTAIYVLIMEVIIYRDVKLAQIPNIVKRSMALVGAILLILCCALSMTDYLVTEEVPMKVLAVIKEFIHEKHTFLMALNIFLLMVGCTMDIFSAIMVVAPLIVPIALQYGVNPIHLAIIFLTNLEIGYLMPPIGINLFISSFRFKRSVTDMYKVAFPFVILLFLCLMVITYLPELSLYLEHLSQKVD